MANKDQIDKLIVYINDNWKYPDRVISSKNQYLREPMTDAIILFYLNHVKLFTNINDETFLSGKWKKLYPNHTIDFTDKNSKNAYINEQILKHKLMPDYIQGITDIGFKCREIESTCEMNNYIYLNIKNDIRHYMYRISTTKNITLPEHVSDRFGVSLFDTFTKHCIFNIPSSEEALAWYKFQVDYNSRRNPELYAIEHADILCQAYKSEPTKAERILEMYCILANIQYNPEQIKIAISLDLELSDAELFIKAQTLDSTHISIDFSV